MLASPSVVVVVPCYNEAARLQSEVFLAFARVHPRIAFLLVDPALAEKQRFARVDVPIFYVEV